MKTIIVISPEYLSAIYKEAKKYSFVIQGYGSFKYACDGLTKVNSSDLLGVIYAGRTIPQKGEKEYTYMEGFLALCELFEKSKSILFVTQSAASGFLKAAKSFSKSRILLRENEIEMTDSLINQGMFGTILRESGSPYVFDEKTFVGNDYENDMSWKIGLSPIVNSDISQILRPVDILESAELTLENDEPFQKFIKSGNRGFALLRKKIIQSKYGITDKVLDEGISNYVSQISDSVEWCAVQTLMVGGGLNV